VGTATVHQKKPHKNIQIFQLLVNKMPFKRICETADISMPSLYDKIEFFYTDSVSLLQAIESPDWLKACRQEGYMLA
jgi:hypothetical protein